MSLTERVSGDESVHMMWNDFEECYYIETRSTGFDQDALRRFLRDAEAAGLELLDEDECEPEVTTQGFVRVYLAAVNGIGTIPVQSASVPCQVPWYKRASVGLAAIALPVSGVGFALANLFAMMLGTDTGLGAVGT